MTLDFPGWTELRLCTERIYDAIFNGELPYGCNGITQNDKALWDSPDLTIRHVDLKRWMRDQYPEQRPAFLFSRRERIAHPIITLETGQAMLVERKALKAELKQCRRRLEMLQKQHHVLSNQIEVTPACIGIGAVSFRTDPSHTTRHAGPHRAVREVEVMKAVVRRVGQSRRWA